MKNYGKDRFMKYIIGSALLALVMLGGCGEKKEEQKVVQKVLQKEAQPEQKQTAIKKVAQDLKMTTNQAIDKGAQLAEEISAESKVIAKEVVAQTKDMTTVALQKVKEIKKELDSTMQKVVKSSKETANSEIDAKQLYVKCAGCHGQKAERKALNMSQVIQGWDKAKIIEAIKGYQSGTYGGAMKTVMAGQVATLTNEEIDVLASYISSLK